MSIGEESTEDLPDWTFMVYLDCDNNLESAGVEDINEMETVGSTEDVNIVVQMDRCETEGYDDTNGDWTGAKRFYVTKDVDTDIIGSEELEDLGEVNMGDPQTLVNFTTWAIDNYPAQKYALVLWDHGGAFWGICWDEDNDEDCITMPELKCALGKIEDHLGRDLDLVGFDACLMAQVAVQYQMRDHVDWGVASGYVEPGEGWPYEKILPKLVADPGMNPKELGIVIADEYVASYTDREEDPDDTTAVTQGVFDLEKMHELAYNLDVLAMVLSERAGNAPQGRYASIQTAREMTNSYDFGSQYFPTNVAPVDPTGYCMYDLIDLMNNLETLIPLDSDIRAAAEAVKASANSAIAYFAVNPYHGNVKGANGLTLYFPSGYDTTYSEAYDEVDLAHDTYWDEFLSHYHQMENAMDTPPAVRILTPQDDYEVDREKENVMSIKGSAFDAQDSLSMIEIKIDDGEWMVVGASGSWYHDLPLKQLDNGDHIVYARSFDGDEYSAEDSVSFSVIGEKQEEEEGLSPVIPVIAIIACAAALAGFVFLKKRK